MTYLSRLALNPRDRRVQRDVADCQALHRTILSAFPRVDGDARSGCGVLYRLEVGRGEVTVLVQSRIRPGWSSLPTNYLAADAGCKSVEELYADIRDGQALRFRIRANPTKRISPSNPGRRTGPRVELQREEDQVDWLKRKGDAGGFELVTVRVTTGLGAGRGPQLSEVPDVRVVAGEKVHGWRATPAAGGARLTFGSVLFDGELRVTDATRFREALLGGIGSGKAYGFGLLSVAPARSQ